MAQNVQEGSQIKILYGHTPHYYYYYYYNIASNPSPAVTVYTRGEASFKPNKMLLKLINIL